MDKKFQIIVILTLTVLFLLTLSSFAFSFQEADQKILFVLKILVVCAAYLLLRNMPKLDRIFDFDKYNNLVSSNLLIGIELAVYTLLMNVCLYIYRYKKMAVGDEKLFYFSGFLLAFFVCLKSGYDIFIKKKGIWYKKVALVIFFIFLIKFSKEIFF